MSGSMKQGIKKVAAGLAVAGLFAAALPSSAGVLTFTDGASTYTVDPFGGFDWQSNATAISGVPVYDGVTQFTTTYLASAVSIKLDGGGDYNDGGSLGTDYEFTIKATLNETATCLSFTGPVCDTARFTTRSGTFEIFYDTDADSDIVAGTGFLDGTKIVSGNFLEGFAGLFGLDTGDLTSGSGNFEFDGVVTFTETDSTKAAYFNPALDSSNGVATLQIGGSTTDWTAPTGWTDGGGFPTTPYLAFQADGNQTFEPQRVPEPGTLALMGLGLAGIGFIRRRRAA